VEYVPPSSWSINLCLSRFFYLLHAGFLLSLFLYPEEGGDMFFRNVDLLARDNIAFIFQKIKLFFRMLISAHIPSVKTCYTYEI
jgi:hypothetical protein